MARDDRRSLARRAEDWAADTLARQGARILERNYTCPAGEIDIVALDQGTLCIVEVKARATDRAGSPGEAVTPAKRRRLARLAQWYRQATGRLDTPVRFDVVEVVQDGEGRLTGRVVRGAFFADGSI